jgi:hypothetical protein
MLEARNQFLQAYNSLQGMCGNLLLREVPWWVWGIKAPELPRNKLLENGLTRWARELRAKIHLNDLANGENFSPDHPDFGLGPAPVQRWLRLLKPKYVKVVN